MSKIKDLAIILHTCDAYERLWAGWFYCWKKFQEKTELFENTPLYVLTEKKSPQEVLTSQVGWLPMKWYWTPTGPGEWSDRLIRGLANIPEPYVLYLQEDFWLDKTLTDQRLQEIMEYARRGEAVRIMGSGKKLMDSLAPPRMEETLRRFDINSPYFFGHAATVWYKPHLMRCLGPGENPWRNCYLGNERCKTFKPAPIHLHYPFEWYKAVHNNVKRTPAWKDAKGDRSLPGEISAYGQQILKDMQDKEL